LGWFSVKQVNSQHEVIRFGVFEADLCTGAVRRKGRQIRLQEQPFQVLALLLARPGELVTRDELDDESSTPRYIETLPRRGHRFIAPVTIATPPSELAGSQSTRADQADLPVTTSPPKIQWKTYAIVLSLGLFVLLASWILLRLTRTQPRLAAAGLSAPIRSLAVLPLQNLSGDKDQEYFAEGMTDGLITDLGQLSLLRVISRTSAMHYRQTSKTLPQIGRELGADAIVEGTVFRSGNRVRITAQLIDARSNRHLWARAYERDLRDLITLQDEVARDIADEVRVKLAPQELADLTTSHPVNPEAHEAYLKGRYYWNQITEEGVKKSFGFFQRAIEKDPKYALGYSSLADYYVVSYVRFALSRNEACPKAEPFALKAVELEDTLAEAHYPLADVRFFCNWDIKGAESEFKRALQLNPSYSEAHPIYAVLLTTKKKGREAVAEAERAVENDPMSHDINMMLGWVYLLDGRYDQAIRQERKTIEMDPKGPNTLSSWDTCI
jgi:TolB-like protein/DNA-binding winged helix-turn-helix (wHTH) protein